MTTFNKATLEQHAQMILDAINDDRITNEMIRDNEVHHEVFNTDYFIIGYYQASKWINENFGDAFNAIDIVKEYEVDNFGEMHTDINSEKIAGMLSYICGEIVISELDQFDTVEELKESLNDYLGAE
tara:strand:- start:2068 stop:2448 length:381 start_codon:yes stop_codon:yes gene_type:complete